MPTTISGTTIVTTTLSGSAINLTRSGISYDISAVATSVTASVSNAVAVTVNTTTPTSIASVTITTKGRRVLLIGTGDQNPNQSGGWHNVQFYRNGSAIGNQIICQNAGASSNNNCWAICYMDSPSAGTYTYAIYAWQGSGSMTYGENGNTQAPTIIAMEIA